MIIVPDRFTYIEAYLTLVCNFNCPYCINEHTGVRRKRKELTTKEWILGLNNISPGKLPITLGGGEPTIREDFYEIVGGLRDGLIIDLLTNGSFDAIAFKQNIPVSRFKPNTASTLPDDSMYKSIRISFHPKISDPIRLIREVKILENAGYSIGIFGLNHPENLTDNLAMTEACHKAGVYFFVRDFLGYFQDRLYGYYRYYSALNGNRKPCQCRIQELLIGSDGNIYRCHRDLYEGINEVGNILNIACEIEDIFRPCDSFGLCNPCDIKLKLEKDLKTQKCSVEIEEI